MEEKILARSEQYGIKGFIICLLIVGILFLSIGAIEATIDYNASYKTYTEHFADGRCLSAWSYQCYDCEKINEYSWFGYFSARYLPASLIIPCIFSVLILLVCIWLRGFDLTVTNKRVYGRRYYQRVDLPVDSISAVAANSFWKSVSVHTSSGRISFSAIKNANRIYLIINELLVDRQRNNERVLSRANVSNSDETDQIKKYKELLDNGIITQEEFDAKKKQLLGL